MSIDHYVSVFSACISFVGLLLVVWQLRNYTTQKESESLVKIYDINRELLTLGFSHPQLFAILQDAKNADPVWERRYLQLWLNQLSLIHSYLKQSVIDPELKETLLRNLTEFMTLENMRQHWSINHSFYPVSFQKLVNDIISKIDPAAMAPVKSGH